MMLTAFLIKESIIFHKKLNWSSPSIKLFKHAVDITTQPYNLLIYGYDSSSYATFSITLDLYTCSGIVKTSTLLMV